MGRIWKLILVFFLLFSASAGVAHAFSELSQEAQTETLEVSSSAMGADHSESHSSSPSLPSDPFEDLFDEEDMETEDEESPSSVAPVLLEPVGLIPAIFSSKSYAFLEFSTLEEVHLPRDKEPPENASALLA